MRILFFILFLYTSIIFPQKFSEDLVPVVTNGSDKVYINVIGVENFTGNDIFVWAVTEHSIPITIESIESKISKTKTYYLLNKTLNKYSILFIIYYDYSNNVLASYDYNRNTDVEVYQYNYPIWENSVEYSILNKCVKIIEDHEDKTTSSNNSN